MPVVRRGKFHSIGGRSTRGPFLQVGNEVRQASTFVVGPFLEALGKMPRQGGADPLRFAVKQVGCCNWSSRSPIVLR